MTSRLTKALLSALLLCAAAFTPARAQDKVSKVADKAASELLNSLKDYLTDVADVRSMKPQEKIDYILKKAEDRVKAHTAETFKGEMQRRMEEFAEKTIRARAVKEIAIPQMLTHLSTGLKYDKGRVDALVASQVDTQMSALRTGITGAKITYSVIKNTNDGGALEGFKTLSSAVYDKMAGYYIPGWSWFKIGVDLTQALGNYVLSYANETAKMAMFADMYPEAKANPSGFAEWLLKRSEHEIGVDVARRWESEQVDFAPYLWEGKGTDSGAVQMRARLRDMLFKIRKDIDEATKDQRAAQAQIEAEARAAYELALAAQKALKDAAYTAAKDADERLEKIQEFKQIYYGYQKSVDYADDGSATGETTGDEPVKSLASYFTFGITLDDLKPQLRQIFFATDWNKGENSQPDISELTGRLDAEWENIQSRYKAEAASITSYCRDLADSDTDMKDVSGRKACNNFWTETKANQAKSESVYRATLDVVSAYVSKLWTENNQNENSSRNKVKIPQGIIEDYALENMARDLKTTEELPGSLNYVGLQNLIFPAATIAPADFSGQNNFLFGPYEEHLAKLRAALDAGNSEMFRTEAVLKELLTRAEGWEDYRKNVAESSKLLEDAQLEALQHEALTVAAKKRLTARFEEIGAALKKASLLAGRTASAESALNRKKLAYATDLENSVKDTDLLSSIKATLWAVSKLIYEVPAKFPRTWAAMYTSGVGAPSPVPYLIFKVSPVPGCARLLTEDLLFDQQALDKALAELEAKLDRIGALETDAVHKTELSGFARKTIAAYLSQSLPASDSIFIPYGKYCVFFAKSFFDEEAGKVAALPMKTWEDGGNMRYAVTRNLYKSMPYDAMGIWDGLEKTDTAKFLAFTRGGHNAQTARSIAAFCAAVDFKKQEYLAYLGKEKTADALEAETDALSAEVTTVENTANASQAKADWEKVSAFESKVTALQTKISAADIYNERRPNLKGKIDNLNSKIAVAKTSAASTPGTRTIGQPTGPNGPVGQPLGPVGLPVVPVKPVGLPLVPVKPVDKPDVPVKPVDQPIAPVKPVDQPIAPVKPVEQPIAPVKPVDKPEVPVKPVDQPIAPVKPMDKPDMPVKPVDQPIAPVKPMDKPDMPVKPVDKPEAPIAPPAKPADKPIGPEKPPVIPTTMDPNLGKIETMYADFKRAYEAKNESQVLRYISPDWDAGDGTSMSELSGYLRNIFTVFNEVKCSISSLNVARKSEGLYKTTYTMVITGRIFDQNIKHEEKSSVEEEVTLNERGKPVISKTMKGNFWYFE